MAVQPDGAAEEIKRLRRCINDLVSIFALPAIWTGSEPAQIVSNLLDGLLSMLSLDLVYARMRDASDAGYTEMVRFGATWGPKLRAEEIGEKLQPWLGDESQKMPPIVRKLSGEHDLVLAPWRLGLQDEIGIIVAGSQRLDFPQQTERLVLNVATNQAAIGLQEARLLSEERRISKELDQRVAERTAEIAAMNDELRKAYARLTQSEERWRSVFENSAIGVVLTDLNGCFIAANPVYQKMLGYTEQELEQRSFLDITVEEDRRPSIALVESLLEGKRKQCQIEKQYRRKDGSRVWVRNSVSLVADTERVPQFLMALSEDVTEQHEARAALQRAFDEIKKSESKLQQVIDTIPTIAWCNLPEGPNEFLNKSWREYTGLSAEGSQGWAWQAAFHPDDLVLLMEKWKKMLVSEEPGEIEARIRRHDGVYRWFLIRASPLRDEQGKLVRWYGTSTDIDDRKRTEEALRENERQLEEAQRLTKTGSYTWSSKTGQLLYWSDELFRIYGFELADSPPPFEKFRERIHPEDRAWADEVLAKTIREKVPNEITFRVALPDGTIKFIHSVGQPVLDASGEVIKVVGTNVDVTERKRAEEALNKAHSELAHVARVTALSTLTASIAHEVNQPLSGIVTNAGTCLRMLDANPPNLEGARETARRTIRDGNRASEVITRLRALFRNKSVSLEPFDLNEAAKEVMALSVSELQWNRVIVQTDLAGELPLVLGDRIQIQQVILNLIRNASDAMSTVEDRPRELLVKTERDENGAVRLSVKDTGTGIDPAIEEKLFDAFHTTKGDGMGIGLSVSRSIMESHQGRLWAMRGEGHGATFVFCIPSRTNT